jgi:hypothetical protein
VEEKERIVTQQVEGTTFLVAPEEQMEEATSKQQLVVALAHSMRSGLKPFLKEKGSQLAERSLS